MKLKDNQEIKQLPRFSGGSYSQNDRIYLQHNKIYLSEVKISNAGDLELTARPLDSGPEQWRDFLKLKKPNEKKVKILLNWLKDKIGENVDSVFNSEFSFED